MRAADTLLLPESAAWRRYFALTKPRVVLLMLFTAAVGMLLAAPTPLPWDKALLGLVGIALASGAGAAVNHVVDHRIDAVMARTCGRPIPAGRLDAGSALGFATLLGASAMLLLGLWVNLLTAALTFAAMIGYAVIYTVLLKRTTPQNVVWGGAAGAAPPLLGAAAVTGEVGIDALLLFLIIFIWTPPHFWPLAIQRAEEYRQAGIPMLPVTHGVEFTKEQVLSYALLLLAVTLLPFALQRSGVLYLVGAVGLGLGFLYRAHRLQRDRSGREPMRAFRYSIVYLMGLFGLLLVDRFAVPWLA